MVKAKNGAGIVSDSIVSDGVIYLMSTDIEANYVLEKLSVYPNPAHDKATISIISQNDLAVDYTLADINGKVIEKKELSINSGINTLEINLHQLHLSKGIYFIRLLSNGKESVKKLIVE
jgi:hypothetical protein